MEAVFRIQANLEVQASTRVIAFMVLLETSVKLTSTNANPILVCEVNVLTELTNSSATATLDM